MDEKNSKITAYIQNKIDTLNKQYENIFPDEKVKKLFDKFLNSDMEYDTLVNDFEAIVNKEVKEYKKNDKNKKVREYISGKAKQLNDKYENILPVDKVEEYINSYKDSDKEYDDIKQEVDQKAKEVELQYKNLKVEEYVTTKAEELNKEYPNIAPKDKIDEVIKQYQDSDKELDDIKQEIDNKIEEAIRKYQEMQKDRNNQTFTQVKNAFQKIQQMLAIASLKLYLSGGTVPYFLLNQDSNRLHDDIDTICDMHDIKRIRETFIASGLYMPEWDSLNNSKDGKDYGFEAIVDGVPVGIYPFEYNNGEIIQYSYDPYTKECKAKSIAVTELTDYITSYRSKDGKVYDTMSLEYIKLTKDSSRREKDIIDSQKIEETNMLRLDVMNRIKMYTVIDTEKKDFFDKRSAKEIEIAGDIRDKNKAIVLQKQSIENSGKVNEVAKQKVLVKPNGQNVSSGFANAAALALIVGFFAGIICTIMYVCLTKV